MRNISRTPCRLAAAGAALLLLTAACGGSGDSADGDDGVTLRFTWWGSDVRHEATQEVIDAFEAEHPDISVTGEFGEWSGYWDKLATTVAAGDAPDVIQMDEAYLREYASRGALLDLSTLDGLDTSAYEESTLATGAIDDGLYGLSAGINSYAFLANPAIFRAAGVEMPDDTSWTWDDYIDVSTRITENTDDGVYGSQSFGNEQAALTVWARQRGESLFTEEGEVAFSEETLVSFFEHTLAMQDAGAVPPASVTAEENSIALDQGVTATGQVALGFMWSNQLHAASTAAGEDLVLLRLPSVEGSAEANGGYYKSSMFWSASARTEHPEEVALFLDFLANSEEAGAILLAERGVPPNNDVRAAVTDELDRADAAAVEYIEDIGDEIGEAPAPPPVGGASVQKIFQRYVGEVLFERMSPADAAPAMIDELSAEVAG